MERLANFVTLDGDIHATLIPFLVLLISAS